MFTVLQQFVGQYFVNTPYDGCERFFSMWSRSDIQRRKETTAVWLSYSHHV